MCGTYLTLGVGVVCVVSYPRGRGGVCVVSYPRG